MFDPLSISLIAERLLLRSRAEVDGGDPTISIICSAVAVEAALTQVFVKWKKIEHNVVKPTATQRDKWEKEYKNAARRDKSRRSGFEKSADLVSKYLTNKMFDDFVSGYVKKSGVIVLEASQVHKELFDKRNRIMHWGDVDFEKDDALSALKVACDAVSVLKAMDRERCEAMERSFRD